MPEDVIRRLSRSLSDRRDVRPKRYKDFKAIDPYLRQHLMDFLRNLPEMQETDPY